MDIQNNNLAIIFPGQSSQHLGMLSDLARYYKLIQDTFSEVSEILGYDLWKLTQFGSIDELNKTCYAQPAILTASVAIWRVWRENGGKVPKIMAGHSLGEYSALVCAESIDLLSAIQLIIIRSQLMQQVSPYGYGAMSVILGLRSSIILELCKIVASEYNQIVAPAVFNADDNIVIAGHRQAIDQVNFLCKKAGAKYVSVLPISVPSHCLIMKPMIDKFRKELKKIIFFPPKIPIINNTNVCIENKPEFICESLVCQLYTPVRWNEIIQKIIEKDIKIVLEMGPSQVLTKLIRRSIYNKYSISIHDSNSLLNALKIVL